MALRTNMRPSPADDDPLDGYAAALARLSRLSIDAQPFLLSSFFPLRPDEHAVKGRPVVLECLSQHVLYSAVQTRNLRRRQRICVPLRMEPRQKEGFVDIDVAQAGHKVLVEQQGFEHTAPLAQEDSKNLRGKRLRQGFRSKFAHDGGYVVDQPDAAKLSLAVKVERTAIRQAKAHAQVSG